MTRAGRATLAALLIIVVCFAALGGSLTVSVVLAGEHDDEEATPTPTPVPADSMPKRPAPPQAVASPEPVTHAVRPTATPQPDLGRVQRTLPAESGPEMVMPRLIPAEPSPAPRPEALVGQSIAEAVKPLGTPGWALIVPRGLRSADGLSLHVLPYAGLIIGAAHEVGVDPAIVAALMETEGSGEAAVSRAGAAGLMQLMPDKVLETDDAFDPATNILRAAQYIRRLVTAYNGDLAAVAAAYFGAIDREGNVTDDSDGNVTGIQYVMIFADAYQRWAAAFDQPTRPIAIRPVIRQRPSTPVPTETASDPQSYSLGGPERDKWYLYVERPQPAVVPLIF